MEQAGFAVLKSPDVPSLLIETGFISNPGEAERLATPAYSGQDGESDSSWHTELVRPPTTARYMLAWQREQGGREVTIAAGDTLSEIAERYGVTVASIKTNNGLSRDVIYVGQTLVIPEA